MMRFQTKAVFAMSIFSVLGLVSCTPPGPVVNTQRKHVIVLPGIGGVNHVPMRMVNIINEEVEGVSAQAWDWTDIEPTMILGDLVLEERNRRRAAKFAESLVEWRSRHPEDQLFIVALSGGGGIVLFAFEQLPENFEVEEVLFISVALSPDVDLTPIMKRSKRGLFNYYSHNDIIILGAGTTLFGTTDRKHRASCGLTGLKVDENSEWADKIEQLRWEPSMRKQGNWGFHLDGFAKNFIRKYVVPRFVHSKPHADGAATSS